MSTTGIESVLTRAMNDSAFSNLLFSDIEQALAGFELSDEEKAKLKGISRADFDSLISTPEERKSFLQKIYHPTDF